MPKTTALDTIGSPRPSSRPPAGMLTRDTLLHAALLISDGPTGGSYYWPEYFATLHPDYATTDVGYNRIDLAWIPRGTQRAWVILEAKEATGPAVDDALTDTLQALRARVGLPAVDLAAMVGVKRRQLYNLLRSGRASADRERWIHLLATAFERLADAAGRDTGRVRAATLRPLADGTSLFDRASAHDEDAVHGAVDELVGLLGEGRVRGLVSRPSPTLKRRGSSAGDFLSEYRDREA